MKYRNFGSAGQVAEDEIFFLPKVLWPKKAIETEFVSVSTKGFMTAKTGRVWDYATVPFTKWLSNKIAGKKSKTPSLGHDLLCELHNLGLMPMDPTRIHTDTFFYTLLLERKFWKIRAKLWFRMVRLGAKFHKHTIKEVIEVP